MIMTWSLADTSDWFENQTEDFYFIDTNSPKVKLDKSNGVNGDYI